MFFSFRCLFLVLAASLARAPAEAGDVRGRAVFDGKAPKPRVIRMHADPKCLEQHKEGFVYQPVSADAKGGLANVFVYVKKGLEGRKFRPPKEPKAVLDQRGCWYYPRVGGVMVGQKMDILNSDPVAHNVNALPEFNIGMPPGLKKVEKDFARPKIMVKIKCDAHPWMATYLGVLEHPYHAVTGPDGTYSIEGLPAGSYTLEAWHEKLGVQARDVSVALGAVTADFRFRAAQGTAGP